MPGCLLYWRLLFLYISCSLFRSLWNSSKFFGLILKENYSYIIISNVLDEVKKGGKKFWKVLGWPDPSPVPAEVGGGAVSGHGGVTLHQLHRHVGAPAALPRLVGRPDPPLGVERATLRQRLGVTNAPAIEVLPKEVSIPVDEPGNKLCHHIITSLHCTFYPWVSNPPPPSHTQSSCCPRCSTCCWCCTAHHSRRILPPSHWSICQ